MKKIILGLVVVLLVSVGIYVYKHNYNKSLNYAGKPTVKIGVIAPLSGDNAEVSLNVKDVLLSYLAEHKGDVDYQLIIEDDGFKVRNVTPLVSKLSNVDKVSGIITIFAYVGMTASPTAAKEGVPHINVGSNPDLADNKFNFLNYTPPQKAGQKMMELLDSYGYKNFAIVHMDHVGPAPYVKEVKKLADALGMKYFDHAYNPTEKDFRMMLFDIKKNNPDVIILMALTPSIDIFRKQMFDSGLHIPVTSINFISTSNNKELFEDVVFVESPDGEDGFVDKVKNELGIDNMFLLAFSEDSLKIFIKIIDEYYKEHGEIPNREQIAEGIKNLKDFEGSAGTYSMGEDGVTQSKAILKKIVNGNAVVIEE
ncbi:MAG: ABC transporter substrate-binding protein [Lactobacillus sp.]|jgi:ABC-type branched-subunit amino acid transport system substrate-binding protein|nr:ABC transporter substrate-binding protein [Lactobacillus sp.]